jgi:hypothetical protein
MFLCSNCAIVCFLIIPLTYILFPLISQIHADLSLRVSVQSAGDFINNPFYSYFTNAVFPNAPSPFSACICAIRGRLFYNPFYLYFFPLISQIHADLYLRISAQSAGDFINNPFYSYFTNAVFPNAPSPFSACICAIRRANSYF